MAPGVRRRSEERERSSLSPWATLASESKGRERSEDLDTVRTAFQVDRDRLLTSVAFRRLADKTHAFVLVDADSQPPFRTRMSHVLAVARVGRTMARGMGLNEDLVEAISYASDLGATPYGSVGEEALAGILDPPFRHEEQSLRIVDSLADGHGLNLSWEVRDGIVGHPATRPPAATLEGHVVRLATRIVTVTDTLNDALVAGLASTDELPSEAGAALGPARDQWATRLMADVTSSMREHPEPPQFSPQVDAAQSLLERFLRRRVLSAPVVREHQDRAVHVLRSLVVFFMESPQQLPRGLPGDATEQRVVDLLSGMGDGAATRLFVRCFTPGATGSG